MIISEASRRVCTTRAQQQAKPGRQIITFMLFANITLWVLDTFMTHRDITQGVQTQFFGLLAWGIISRISLPLLIFYRFHSCVVLVEIWKNTYRCGHCVQTLGVTKLIYCIAGPRSPYRNSHLKSVPFFSGSTSAFKTSPTNSSLPALLSIHLHFSHISTQDARTELMEPHQDKN